MSLFDYLNGKLDIVDVISSYLPLKRIGGYLKASCPFHQEKDASFTVSPHRNMYFCFGCKKSGDIISFVADLEQLSQYEAANFLADRFKIEIPVDFLKGKESFSKKDLYYLIHQKIVEFCQKSLLNNPLALDYLSQRGVSKESINTFGIGYFPGQNNIKKHFVSELLSLGVLQSDLAELGLFSNLAKNDLISPFQDRIIFPITDALNRPIGLGGRVFLAGDSRPKYYNSKESPLFEKKKSFYGYPQAKSSIVASQQVIVVEGYLDVVLTNQVGIKNVVATLGTSFSQDHLLFLQRVAKDLLLMYDPDSAGIAAMIKLAELSFASSLEIKVVTLKDIDPAAYAVSDPEGLKEEIGKANDILNYFVLLEGKDFFLLNQADKLKRLEKIINIIKQVPDKLKRYVLLQKISVLSAIPYQFLLARCSYNSFSQQETNQFEPGSKTHVSGEWDPEHFLLAWLLFYRGQSFFSQQLWDEFLLLLSDRLLQVAKNYDLDFNLLDSNQDPLKEFIEKQEDYIKLALFENIIKLENNLSESAPLTLLNHSVLILVQKRLREYGRSVNLSCNDVRSYLNRILATLKNIKTFLQDGNLYVQKESRNQNDC